MRKVTLTVLFLLVLCASVALAQDQPEFKPAAGNQVQSLPNFPTCAKAAPVHGDPSKGAAVIYAKFPAGCGVPTHWHSANERLIAISGTMRMEHQGGKPETAQKGEFIFMPAKHQHSATCTTACEFYIVTDGPFDIHYVDASGKEIPPDQALAAKKPAGGAKKK